MQRQGCCWVPSPPATQERICNQPQAGERSEMHPPGEQPKWCSKCGNADRAWRT